MPALDKPRWEEFAQGVALGKSATRAYIDAGFSEKGADAGAARLSGIVRVSVRIKELQNKLSLTAGITRAEYLSELVDTFKSLPREHSNWPRIADLIAKAAGFNEPERIDVTTDMQVVVRIGGKVVET